jgi:hypothetical protein
MHYSLRRSILRSLLLNIREHKEFPKTSRLSYISICHSVPHKALPIMWTHIHLSQSTSPTYAYLSQSHIRHLEPHTPFLDVLAYILLSRSSVPQTPISIIQTYIHLSWTSRLTYTYLICMVLVCTSTPVWVHSSMHARYLSYIRYSCVPSTRCVPPPAIVRVASVHFVWKKSSEEGHLDLAPTTFFFYSHESIATSIAAIN